MRALLSLPEAFAVMPDPADRDEHDPAAAGAIAHGIVTFHDPRQPLSIRSRARSCFSGKRSLSASLA